MPGTITHCNNARLSLSTPHSSWILLNFNPLHPYMWNVIGLFKSFFSAPWIIICELIWREWLCLPNFAAKYPRNSFSRKCSKISHITHWNKKNTSSSRKYSLIKKWIRLTFQESFLIGWILKVVRKICLFTTWVNFLSENGGECREMRSCGRGRWILGVLCLLWQETP